MKLQVTQMTKIKDLQKKFSDVYPFLKIEFYKSPHKEKKLSFNKDKLLAEKIISEEAKFFKTGSINMNEDQTVTELEKDFYQKFGIAMQVFRKSRQAWIETSFTDNRTLKEQNELGRPIDSTITTDI